MDAIELKQALIELIGDEAVSTEAEVLQEHSIDRWYASNQPDVVVFARSTEDVSQVLAFAHEHEVPVTTRGAGIGYVGGAVPVQAGIVLSVARMNQILEVNPADGVAVVEPGVITGDLQDAVESIGWYYPPDPASLRECSIGGNIATNAGGPRCVKYGVTKQYVLGLTVVLADGTVVETGGRCHKNKQGFDLTTAFVGSEGLLGVVTQATLRLIPKPQWRSMLTATFPQFADAAAAVQAIFNAGHLPSGLEITDSFTLSAARAYLGENALPEGNAHLIVEIDGRKTAVASELEELETLLQGLKAIQIDRAEDAEACEAIWKLRRDFSYSLRATGLTKLNEDIVVPRSKLVELVEFADKLQEKAGIDIACFRHAGDGNIHTNLMVDDYTNPEVREKADAALDELFTWIIANRGAITGEHGVGLAKKRWLPQALGEANIALHRQVKAALDSKDILNPGKFL